MPANTPPRLDTKQLAKLLLHIGFAKTGTTSIQRCMVENLVSELADEKRNEPPHLIAKAVS